METLLKFLEFFLGATGMIAWVTLLGLGLSLFAPEKIRKRKITFVECITMGGIGLFCPLLTLFFLFLAPKMGLAKVELSALMGTLLAGGKEGGAWETLSKWGGRYLLVTFGVLCSFLYATLFFNKIKLSTKYKGLLFGLGTFLIASFFFFPALSIFPALRFSDLSTPSIMGPIAGGLDTTLTFLAAMVIFGGLMSGIYYEWEEI